ncbi:MAG: NUDIX pyrophosphatase [Calditrichaeota bacterium]|nr:NUDIX pyrophosphatase [Calditrichota bacterium]
MSRAQFQVLVIPYRITSDNIAEYAIMRRSDLGVWQFVSGGGEDDETPLEAAKREANEEAGIPYDYEFIQLDSIASIPAGHFAAREEEWGEKVYVLPEYSFAVFMEDKKIKLSFEHTEVNWLPYAKAYEKLKWDSNRIALWELNERLKVDSYNSGHSR